MTASLTLDPVPYADTSVFILQTYHFPAVLAVLERFTQIISADDVADIVRLRNTQVEANPSAQYLYQYRVLDMAGKGEFSIKDLIANTQFSFIHVLLTSPPVFD